MNAARNTLQRSFKLVASIGLPLILGAMAGIVTSEAIPVWYGSLRQPSFNPPNWIFGPVWVTLYILMGISCYLIWVMTKSRVRDTALIVYLIQLALNFIWSFIFFYFKLIGTALIEISILWIAIVVMILGFGRLKPWAAYLNVPYILWVTFAMILNASYFLLNP